MRARRILDLRPDQVNRRFGDFGWWSAGQALTHQQAQRRCHRHFLGRSCPHDRVRPHPHLGHPVEVTRHPQQFGTAQRLDPRLLDGVPDIARNAGLGLVDIVEPGIVVQPPQRE